MPMYIYPYYYKRESLNLDMFSEHTAPIGTYDIPINSDFYGDGPCQIWTPGIDRVFSSILYFLKHLLKALVLQKAESTKKSLCPKNQAKTTFRRVVS